MKTRPKAALAELRPLRAATTEPDEPVVMLRCSQLQALMREAAYEGAREALASAQPAAGRASLLSVQAMADRLGVSRSKVNSMRIAGCPAVRLGKIFRFDPDAVLAWLKARGDRS